MTIALVIGFAALGAVAGGVADVVVVRVPRRDRVLAPGAGKEIRPGRAVPLAAASAALGGLTAARYHDSWALPAYAVLAFGLLVLSIIDLEHFLLPNRVVYPTTAAVLVLLAVASVGDDRADAFVRALLGGGAAFGALFVLHVVSPRSLGFGDVRLAFVLGMSLGWLGWRELFLGIFLGFLYGAVVGAVLVVTRLRGRKDHVPFGPFLAAGTLTVVLWGDAILRWYDAR